MATGCVYIDGLRSLARANASTLHELRRHFAAHTEREAKLQWEADSVALKRNGTSLRDPAAKAWLLRATAPTSFVTASEIRAKFAGIVFVGDSQLRENAWATMRWLSESQLLRYAHAGEAFNNTRNCPRVGCGGRVVANVCLPEAAGRLGFTATCGPAPLEVGTAAPTEVDLAEIKPPTLFCPKSASPSQACRHSEPPRRHWRAPGFRPASADNCQLFSPLSARQKRDEQLLRLDGHGRGWNGSLWPSSHSVAREAVCASDFFVHYEAIWGAGVADPSSLPNCLRGLHQRRRKPLLWVVQGGGLHELIVCDPPPLTQRHGDDAPRTVVSTTAALLQRDHDVVVYQPVGSGFLEKPFTGACEGMTVDDLAEAEVRWVPNRGIRFVDYPTLARQFALLQTDGKHWTHYAFPCHDQAPELTRLLAQLTMQAAMDRPLDVCGGEGVR